jgi:hypothetical protein
MKNNIKRIVTWFVATGLLAATLVCLWTAFAPKARAESCEDWCHRQSEESRARCNQRYQPGRAQDKCISEAYAEEQRCLATRCKPVPER